MKTVQIAVLATLICVPSVGAGWQAPTRKSHQTRKAAPTKVKTPKPTTCTISGFSFAITKGGDLKRARMAKVYLLEPEPYLTFLKKYNAIFKQSFEGKPESYSCKGNLTAVDLAMGSASLDEMEKGRFDSIHETRTDEEGNFRFEGLKPGEYALIGRGQAGANDVYWRLDEVKVEPGQNVVLKLSQVKEACLLSD